MEKRTRELRLALRNILKQKVAFCMYYIRTFALVPPVLTALYAALSIGPNLARPSLHVSPPCQTPCSPMVFSTGGEDKDRCNGLTLVGE